MKRTIRFFAASVAISILMTSCYTYTTVVGRGAQGTTQVKKWNHYLIDGLVPVDVSDPKVMAGDASDYTVTTEQSFVNGLLASITFGIYTPTTTKVTK